jgi:predicted alpha/beta-fold hydrolase
MGIEWYVRADGSGRPTLLEQKHTNPILLLLPGLGGGSNNLYTHSLAAEAQKQGFNCGVVLFRCAENIPITSCRLTCSSSGEDATAAIDYVFNKYVKDNTTNENRTRLYAYGTSLGGNLLGLHLI